MKAKKDKNLRYQWMQSLFLESIQICFRKKMYSSVQNYSLTRKNLLIWLTVVWKRKRSLLQMWRSFLSKVSSQSRMWVESKRVLRPMFQWKANFISDIVCIKSTLYFALSRILCWISGSLCRAWDLFTLSRIAACLPVKFFIEKSMISIVAQKKLTENTLGIWNCFLFLWFGGSFRYSLCSLLVYKKVAKNSCHTFFSLYHLMC